MVGSAYEYDGLNRLTELVHNDGMADIAFYRFTYAAGRITQIIDLDGTRTYSYDDTDQLTEATSSNPGLPDEVFAYDANGN